MLNLAGFRAAELFPLSNVCLWSLQAVDRDYSIPFIQGLVSEYTVAPTLG